MLGVCQTEPLASWGTVHWGLFGKDQPAVTSLSHERGDQSHTHHLQTLSPPSQQDKGGLSVPPHTSHPFICPCPGTVEAAEICSFGAEPTPNKGQLICLSKCRDRSSN